LLEHCGTFVSQENQTFTIATPLGPKHPQTATRFNNLALLLESQGDLAGARRLYERALAVLENALGPGHPNTAQVRNSLSALSPVHFDGTKIVIASEAWRSRGPFRSPTISCIAASLRSSR
jgi:Tetratricopeptide repeat